MSGSKDRVVMVQQPVQVVRSVGQPAVARAQRVEVQLIRAGMPGRDGQDAPQPEPFFDYDSLILATLSI